MKKIGLKYPVCANYSESTGKVTYSNGIVMGKAMSAGIAWTKNNAKILADDEIDEIDQSVSGGTINLGINELIYEVQAMVLGHQLKNGELFINELDIAPYLGFGFYGKVKRNGMIKYRAVWLKKVQFSEPNDDTNTQGETVAFQTPSIEGVIMKDMNGDFKQEKVFDNEQDAKAYLNEKAGIPTSASAGLTGLVVTGTGGTLTPAFSASNRNYAFTGLTGTSFTVTATAESHNIKLYVDDNFTQNLTSGVASSAIQMAAGTKKIKIVANEAGKTTQTTEIIIIK